MQFYKLQATGNDFIFFLNPSKTLDREQIAALCHRHFGIGADGLVFLRSTSQSDFFEWTFYNVDGGEAEMCGNAARATIRLLWEIYKKETVQVKAQKSIFVGQFLKNKNISVDLSLAAVKIEKIDNLFGGRFPVGFFTNTGVPHCVIPVEKISQISARAQELNKYIFDANFGKAGSNLTFFSVQKENHLEAVTLERGVNDFTLSCGTGVIAAAQVHLSNKINQGPVYIKTPGGELTVEFLEPGKARLTGGAKIVFEGRLS
jgi:diaminopimelate epimerase